LACNDYRDGRRYHPWGLFHADDILGNYGHCHVNHRLWPGNRDFYGDRHLFLVDHVDDEHHLKHGQLFEL
jgi:hypothetical protein